MNFDNMYRRDNNCSTSPLTKGYEEEREFVDIIAQVEENKLREAIKSARFVSITCDGSTEEMVFVRYCEQGECCFVFLEPVEKSNAVNITAAIEQACQTHLEFATGWEYDRLEGIARTCNKCGVHLLDVKLASLLDDTSGILEWK